MAANTTFGGVIEDGNGILSVRKVGGVILTLTGENTFTGDLAVLGGTLALGGATGSVDTQLIKMVRGSLLLDNTANNNNDRISDTATVSLAQGFGSNGLVMRRNSVAGVNSHEEIGTLSVQNGHNVVRFDHSAGGSAASILANVLTLEMNNYTRGVGGTVAFTEFATAAAPGGYSYFSSAAPAAAETLTKIILNTLPSQWLVGGDGASGYNRKVLIGAFGNLSENSVLNRFGNRLMTVETINNVNYIRPLDSSEFRELGGGATTKVISSGNLAGGTLTIQPDDNVKVTGVSGTAVSPLTIRVGPVDNALAGHLAFNSLWVEAPSSATVAASVTIRLADFNVVHLGDYAGDELHAAVTGGSGTIFLDGGRLNASSVGLYGSLTLRGGTLDFGSREALLYLDVTNSASIYSTMTGTGGVTKTGGGQAHFFGWNNYSGITTQALNELWVYTDTALGKGGVGNEVVNYATFLINSGINIGSVTDSTLRKDLLFRAGTFFSAGAKANSWNGDIILDSTLESGEYGALTFTVRANASMIINGDVTGTGSTNPALNTGVDSGRTITIQNDNTTTTSVRSTNGTFVINGELADIDGRAALNSSEKLVLSISGYISTNWVHNKFNLLIDDARNSNASVGITSGYLHLEKGLGVDGTTFNRTVIRQNDGSTTFDRAGAISAILLGSDGAAYRTGAFLYGNTNAAYSSNSTLLIGGENTSGTVYFGNSNGSTTFTFGMHNTPVNKAKATNWTNVVATKQPTASSAQNTRVIAIDTSNIVVGMIVTGTGVPAGTQVLSVQAGSITLNQPLTGTGVTTSTSLTFASPVNTIQLADVTNLQVGMGISGTGIRAGTVITAIDAVTGTVTLSAPVNAAISSAALNFTTATPVTIAGTTRTQNFGEARLYQMAGGTAEFNTTFTDGAGYRADLATGALSKVGRGTVVLNGGTSSSDINGGINVFGGTLVLNYSGKADGYSHISGLTTNQNNPYQLTMAGGELRLTNEGSLGDTNTEYMRGVLTLRAGNSSVTLNPGDEKTLNLHLGLVNTGVQIIDNRPNPGWYWRAPDRFAGATVNFFSNTRVKGAANFYYSQYAPEGAGLGGVGLGTGTIIPYSTYKYLDENGTAYVDFAAFLFEMNGNTRIVDAAGYVANSASVYSVNSGAGAPDVGVWTALVNDENVNGYFTDDDFSGVNGYSGNVTGNRYSTGDASYNDIVGVRAIRFAASAAGGSTITIGSGAGSADRLVLGTQGPNGWDGAGWTSEDGGAILVSNSVGAASAGISGGYLTSALPSTYFTAAVAPGSMSALPGPTARDLIIHNYNMGSVFTIDSTIVDYTENHDYNTNQTPTALAAVTKLNLVVAGPGTTLLKKATNYYTGTTYVSGGAMADNNQWEVGTLWVGSVESLGSGGLHLNGGRLRFAHTSTPQAQSLGSLGFSRSVTLGGNGGYFDVTHSGTTLTISGYLRSEDNVLSGNIASTQMAANPGVGDLIKEGAGRLILTKNEAIPATFATTPNSQQFWNAYYGLTIVKAGTLQVNIGNIGDSGILGSNDSTIDGTIVEEGARLDVQITNSGAGTKEWITLDGGTLGTTAAHSDGYIDGVMTITSKGATFDIAGTGNLRVNGGALADGFLTGTGNVLKTGTGTLFLYQNNMTFTGNWDIQQGRVNGYGQGMTLGAGGTITLGSPTATSGEASLLLSANQLFTSQYRVTQDIVVRANVTGQVRNIGAGLSPVTASGRNQDSFFFEGDITLNGDAHLVFIESSAATSLAPVAGELQYSHVTGAYRNLLFNGHFSGSGNLYTDVTLTGVATNGAKVTFLINGDNSSANGQTAWTGTLTTGNATLNNLQEHFIRMGNNLAMTAANKVELGYNSAFQLGGKTVSIGDLKARVTGNASTNKIYVENAANDEGTLRVVQTANTDWDILFQDGVTPEWYSSASAAVYSNRLNLVKAGAGTAVLTQLNTYTGTTVVETGNLQVGRGGVGTRASADAVGRTGTGALSVNNGGVLSGTGVVQARSGVVHSVNSGGKIAPGDAGGSSLGTLFMDGGLVLNAGGTLEFQISKATHWVSGLSDVTNTSAYSAALLALPSASELSGTIGLDMHDHLEINGQMDLSGGGLGAGTISLVDLNYLSTAKAGDVFNLIDWASVNGTGFNAGGTYRVGGESGSNLLLPTLGNGLAWDTSLFTNHGILIVTTAPEPGRVMLVMVAWAAWALRRRRARAGV
ncbi:autotransporter-associated beta strand repeat-containing protein [Verrucomicrobium sp. BvORR034]|uniref:beta strand repeat-containing protein n=1 Tax=Verrucomicrobium sp. BvORR034 TaxID=1396418 RepID=UPI002240F0F7|nr:autotransporter-associated beta strand repeat-containing protein [Verrucomicrobium sp. BvORR034]